MGQSASAPLRPQARDAAGQDSPYLREPLEDVRAAPDELEAGAAEAPAPLGPEPSFGGGVRRRRSTADGTREYKRQRPHLPHTTSDSSGISSVSSSRESFETARSQTSAGADSSQLGATQSRRSSAAGGTALQRLTDQVRSVFSNRPAAATATSEPSRGPYIPRGFVNTAVPGTPGLLEDLEAPPYEPRAGSSDIPPPLPISSGPAPAYTERSEDEPRGYARAAETTGAASAGGAVADDVATDADERASQASHARDAPRPHGRRGQITRDETTQIEMLSRVLLAAASLTALRLVGNHFGRGELYGGSNEAAAMRRRAQAEIASRREQREREEREEREQREQREERGEHGESEERESRHTTENSDTNASVNTNAGANAAAPPPPPTTPPSDAANRSDDTQASETPSGLPQEYTFAAFLEQLRTGRHSAELSDAMFGSPESNFFRLFRFQEDVEGRIPILLMGIRAAERGAQTLDAESGDDVWEPRRRESREQYPHNSDDHDAAHTADAGVDFDLDGAEHLDYGFSDYEEDLHHGAGFHTTADDRASEGLHARGGAHHDADDSDRLFEDDEEDEEDGDEEEDEFDDNPFRPDDQHPDAGARLLNSLMSTLTGADANRSHHHDHHHDDDAWFRPRQRRPSLARADSEQAERAAPRQQQSWVIYVIGGAYPRTHPIFFAPSLMTDNPTYEDLLIVEDLLGPVKPPVATRSDLDSAGGTFAIHKNSELLENRCPVCLMDYQEHDVCRTLSCKHTFHQECVDSWLMRSHNTCPMCRTEGVPSSRPDRPEPPGFAAA